MSYWQSIDRRHRFKLGKKVLTGFLVMSILEGLTTIILSSYLSSNQIRCSYTQIYNTAAYLGIFTGIVIVFVSVHGLRLIYQQVNYFVSALVIVEGFSIICFGIVVPTIAHVYKNKVINHELFAELLQYLQEFSSNTKYKTCWQSMQDKFKCCGLQHFSDWANTSLQDSFTMLVKYSRSATTEIYFHLPDSCECKDIPRQQIMWRCVKAVSPADSYYYISSCYPLYEDMLLQNLNILRTYFPVLLAFQIMQFSLVFCFVLKINKLNAVQQVYTVS